MADNESEWPAQSQDAQYPRDNWQAAPAGSAPADDGPPTAAQVPPTTPYVPPATPYGPPAAPYVPPVTPYGYQVPPAGYQVPPGGYPVPPGGYPVPPGGYQVPAGGYQMQARMNPAMNPAMRAASADRERAVDVLKAGFAEGRLTQDEYNERMNRAYTARTYAELIALTADLPAGAMPVAYPMAVYQPPVTTNSLARAALVLGVAEFICGHMAKREMRQTGQRGDGLATSGLVLGYMAVIFWGILIVLSIVGAVISATGTAPGP